MRFAPEPTVMPVDRQEWASRLALCNFVNAFYVYRDLGRLDSARRVLFAGPGQGLDPVVLRWRGYEVTTFDIDETFHPDEIGSVHDLSRFASKSFDAVVASHVLEHMAVPYLDAALAEIARVARFAVLYFPVAGRHAQLRMIPGFHGFDWSWIADLFNVFHRPDGITPRYCKGQHFWEVGYRGFRKRDLITRFSRSFDVLSCYRNRDWLPSLNFVLRSRSHHPEDPASAPRAVR
jgi:hypothetical protein